MGTIQTNGIIQIDDDDMIMTILKRDIKVYFSTISPILIRNWQILCENYFKFYINHFRLLKCSGILLEI